MNLFKSIRKNFKKEKEEKQIEKGYTCPRCNRITYIKNNTKDIINGIYKFAKSIFNEVMNEDIVLIEDYEEEIYSDSEHAYEKTIEQFDNTYNSILKLIE